MGSLTSRETENKSEKKETDEQTVLTPLIELFSQTGGWIKKKENIKYLSKFCLLQNILQTTNVISNYW